MAVLIGHSSINEKGTTTGGSKGDQTGKEVCIRNWYLHKKGWAVIRPNNPEDAEKIAKCMEMICANDNIGYCQTHRLSGIDEAAKYNYNPSKIKVKCELDCSSAVRLCCLYAGIKPANFVTANEVSALNATGRFTIFTSDKYCKSSNYLKRGDILVTRTSGHTVVVLSDGAKVTGTVKAGSSCNETKVKYADSYDKNVAGNYITTGKLNLRYGAGILNKKIITMPKEAQVKCYGYYTNAAGRKWLLVEYGDYVGFCSTKYLKKK